MSWVHYRTALEGLAEEEPWLPTMVELREGVEREPPDEEPSFATERDAFAKMGLKVQEMG